MVSCLALMCAASVLLIGIYGHGHMTFPPSRHGGSYSNAGYCADDACMWFSQPTVIPGEPTVNAEMHRTFNVKIKDGPKDWTRKFPWRAPGTAPVIGSGCGVAGGNVVPLPNGGNAVPGLPRAFDGAELPETSPTVWQRGSTVEVAYAITANHGGGSSWRLCKKGGNITEECFQQNVLRFAPGNVSWLQYSDIIPHHKGFIKLPRVEVPRVVVSEGTFPEGSEWVRNPMPACFYCDQAQCGNIMPNMTALSHPGGAISDKVPWKGGEEWYKQEKCAQDCSGYNLMQCPPGMTQFPEPLPGISGYLGNVLITDSPPAVTGIQGFLFSIVDQVVVPENISSGDYILSWRWDCEQSPQIWENCADVQIVDGGNLV